MSLRRNGLTNCHYFNRSPIYILFTVNIQVQKQNVALVTGSSSGIGYETSLLLAKSGFHTYASMRNLEKSKSISEIANKEKLPLEII